LPDTFIGAKGLESKDEARQLIKNAFNCTDKGERSGMLK